MNPLQQDSGEPVQGLNASLFTEITLPGIVSKLVQHVSEHDN
ncbi:MAG: hypothetical protein ACFFD4_26510 [Candidatus Odinarchaeota archaeon]